MPVNMTAQSLDISSYVVGADGRIRTNDPTGSLGGGMSGGTSAFAYSIDALNDSGTLTLTTDGTHDFDPNSTGGPASSFMVDAGRAYANQATYGDITDANLNIQGDVKQINYRFGTGRLQMSAETDMPGGVAVEIGSNASVPNSFYSNQLEFRTTNRHAKCFSSRIRYWPQATVDGFETVGPNIDGNTYGNQHQWNLKSIWFMNDAGSGLSDGAADGTDFFVSSLGDFLANGAWNTNEGIFTNETAGAGTIQQNWGLPTQLSDPSYTGVLNYGIRPSPILQEEFFDLGSVVMDANDCSYDVISTLLDNTGLGVTGQRIVRRIASGINLVNTENGAAGDVNVVTVPGYVEGFPNGFGPGYHQRWGDIYTAFGDGAAIRAYLSNHSDWVEASKRMLLQPIFGSVSSTSIQLDLRQYGQFDLSSLSGSYINLIGDDNVQIASVMVS